MGATGAIGRCFPLFKEYQQCLMSTDPKQCLLLREDYFECLHNFNRNQRSATIDAHMRQQKTAAKNEA
jgi:NADH dehydrogenase (ubiquinone) Fe-S protein 5